MSESRPPDSAGQTPSSPSGALTPANPEGVAEVQRAYDRIRAEVHKVIVGQDEVLEQALLALFCGGHALIEGVPGLAKTLLVSTLARTLSLGFARIQFTPDLMPSDMTGTEVIEEDKATGSRELRFV
ncbi:MAG: AAA family ATPase, partial [Anaerolineae bacterium]|nr:AAA family ATPase [Anaerolineae bacterium]